MGDIWEDTDKRAKESAGSGIFVRLEEDGDKFVGAFIGDPYPQELFWDQKEGKYVPYTAEHEKRKDKMTLRVSLNVFVIAENGEKLTKPTVSIFEMNATTFRSVVKVRKRYGFEKTYFEVERSGKKKDPNTTYSVLPDEPIEPAELEAIKKLKLHDLAKKARGESSDGGEDDYDKTDSGDEPIGKPDAQALVEVLRKVPRTKLDEFLAKFGIAKVKELKQKDLAEARKFVGLDGTGEDEGEEDPFAD